MTELLVGAFLVAGTLTWSRYESVAARRAGRLANESEESGPTRRRVALGFLMLLGVTLIVSGITGS